jgi:uncharacterized membrane protein YqjE
MNRKLRMESVERQEKLTKNVSHACLAVTIASFVSALLYWFVIPKFADPYRTCAITAMVLIEVFFVVKAVVAIIKVTNETRSYRKLFH